MKTTIIAALCLLTCLIGCDAREVATASGERALESAGEAVDLTATAAVLAAGRHVGAGVVVGADGSLTAKEVHVKDRLPETAGAVKVGGPVQAVDPAAGTITILGVTAIVSPTAEFKGAVAALSEIAIGAPVDLRGVVESDGSVTANEVHARLPGLGGVIQSVSGSAVPLTIRLVGRDVLVDENTVVKVKKHKGKKGKGHGKGHKGGHEGDDGENEQEGEYDDE
jgi:hypothetical protein